MATPWSRPRVLPASLALPPEPPDPPPHTHNAPEWWNDDYNDPLFDHILHVLYPQCRMFARVRESLINSGFYTWDYLYMLDWECLDDLTYPNPNSHGRLPLPTNARNHLLNFQYYCRYFVDLHGRRMTTADWEAFSASDLEAFRASNADKMDVDWEELLALEDSSVPLVMSHVPTVVPTTDVEDLSSSSTSVTAASHATLDAGVIDIDPVYMAQETGHFDDDLQEDDVFPWFSKYCLAYYYGISQPVVYHTDDDARPLYTSKQVNQTILVNDDVRHMPISRKTESTTPAKDGISNDVELSWDPAWDPGPVLDVIVHPPADDGRPPWDPAWDPGHALNVPDNPPVNTDDTDAVGTSPDQDGQHGKPRASSRSDYGEPCPYVNHRAHSGVIDNISGFGIFEFAFAFRDQPVGGNPADNITSVTALAEHINHLDSSPNALRLWSSHKYSGRLFVDNCAFPAVDHGMSGFIKEGRRPYGHPLPYDRPSSPPLPHLPPPRPIPIRLARRHLRLAMYSTRIVDACASTVIASAHKCQGDVYSYVASPIGEDVDSSYYQRNNMSIIPHTNICIIACGTSTIKVVTENRVFSAHHVGMVHTYVMVAPMGHATLETTLLVVSLSLDTLETILKKDHSGDASSLVGASWRIAGAFPDCFVGVLQPIQAMCGHGDGSTITHQPWNDVLYSYSSYKTHTLPSFWNGLRYYDSSPPCPYVIGSVLVQDSHVLMACEVDWGPLISIDGEPRHYRKSHGEPPTINGERNLVINGDVDGENYLTDRVVEVTTHMSTERFHRSEPTVLGLVIMTIYRDSRDLNQVEVLLIGLIVRVETRMQGTMAHVILSAILLAAFHSKLRPPAEPPPARMGSDTSSHFIRHDIQSVTCWMIRDLVLGQSSCVVMAILARVSVDGVLHIPDAIGIREKGLSAFQTAMLTGTHKYNLGSPAGSVTIDLARGPECKDSRHPRLVVVPLLQWDSSMGMYHDARHTVAAMLTLVLSDARMCWRKRHFDRGKEGPPYQYESLPVRSRFKGTCYNYYGPTVPDGHARTQLSVYCDPNGVGGSKAANQLVANDQHGDVTSIEAQNQGQMALVAVCANSRYPHRRVLMGSSLVHSILYLDLALSALVLVSTIMAHGHEGRDKMASPRKGTTTTATVDAFVDDHVGHSGVCAIAPITVAAQLQDLLDLDRGIGLGDGDGLYILRSVTMHGEPPPPPEPPPWINRSPSTNVEDPTCSTTGSLGTHGDTSLRDGEPAIPLITLHTLGVIPVYGESILFALRRGHKVAGRKILSYIAGEIILAHGVLSSIRRDILCPRSQQ